MTQFIEVANEKKPEVRPLFATPIVKVNINREFTTDELKLLLYDIPVVKDETTGMTNHQSDMSSVFDHYEELKNIKDFCEREINDYLEQIEGVITDKANLKITMSWLNRNKSQEEHPPHFHANSYLSGVLYLQCLSDDAIIFSNRLHKFFDNFDFPREKHTIWTAPMIRQKVIEGDLVIFPSWLMHSVEKNEAYDKERVSLSFNTFPIGKMGNTFGTALDIEKPRSNVSYL